MEERLGHRFADPGLLDRALTHTSHAHEQSTLSERHNEPLEFLGDAVLGFVVAELLHRRDPEGSEGSKSKARAHLVAALYLDGGLEAAARFIASEFAPDLATHGLPQPGDYKSTLQELLQARGQAVPEYVTAAEEGPSHRRSFRVQCVIDGSVVAEGQGYSKKQAQQEAARRALPAVRKQDGEPT